MFLIKSRCLFLILFSGVHSQMDVILKKTTSKPLTHENLLSKIDADSKLTNIHSENQEILKRHERVQDDLKKIGVHIDPEMKNKFGIFPHPLHPDILNHIFNEQRQTHDPKSIPTYSISLNSDDSDDDSADEENPLLDMLKLMDHPMSFPPFGPRISFGSEPDGKTGRKASTRGQDDEDFEPVGVLTIIKIDDNAPLFANGDLPSNRDVKTTFMDSNMESSFVDSFVKGLMSTMKDMVNLVRNTSISLNSGEDTTHNGTKPPIDIKIQDHGRTYDIPYNAYIERTEPDVVNITWRSELKDLNNSLCMNVSKDKDGQIVFHHIRLRMLNGQGLQEYNREDPVHLGQNKENSTEINLADGVGLRFPHPDSLDVVVVEKRGKFSAQWLAVSVALLGLIVAGLIMLLSYIIHSRNSYYARKDSMSKEPIA